VVRSPSALTPHAGLHALPHPLGDTNPTLAVSCSENVSRCKGAERASSQTTYCLLTMYCCSNFAKVARSRRSLVDTST